jgi:hypothetical protein
LKLILVAVRRSASLPKVTGGGGLPKRHDEAELTTVPVVGSEGEGSVGVSRLMNIMSSSPKGEKQPPLRGNHINYTPDIGLLSQKEVGQIPCTTFVFGFAVAEAIDELPIICL